MMKDAKTRAEPVSFCSRAMTAGIPIKIKAENHWVFRSFSVLALLKNLAMANAVANFANSIGWMLKLPILIHALAPLMSVPMNTTDNINNMKAA